LELPIGLAVIFVVLLATALVNLVTKRVATEWGVVFTIAFFALFWISERVLRRGQAVHAAHLEKFNVRYTSDLDPRRVGLNGRARVLVPVRDPRNLAHLDRALHEAERDQTDVVVLTVRLERAIGADAAQPNFTIDEQRLLTAVVDLAERHGRT